MAMNTEDETKNRCMQFLHECNRGSALGAEKSVDDFVKFINSEVSKAYVAAAEVFEIYASDQIASQRFQSAKRAKAGCVLRAEIWNDAAKELRAAAAKEP